MTPYLCALNLLCIARRSFRQLPFVGIIHPYFSSNLLSVVTYLINSCLFIFQELNDTESLRSYGADHFFDRHSDMRLDVDNMSYEVGFLKFSALYFHFNRKLNPSLSRNFLLWESGLEK